MLGGIIGDLAASTYLRDKDTFYSRLIDDESTLSEFGLTIFAANNILYGNDRVGDTISDMDVKAAFDKYFSEHEYVRSGEMSEAAKNALLLVRLETAGWYDRVELQFAMMFDIHVDKEEGYARLFTPAIIQGLRRGMTKDGVYESLGPIFKSIRHHWEWRNGTSPLCLLMRAWDCFYKSFDYGSAIHNAVRNMPENPRLMAALVGMMASAMYGNGIYYKKRKFSPDNFNTGVPINIYPLLGKAFRRDINDINIQVNWQKEFFKKNEALTNVERHVFTNFKSRFEGMMISDVVRRRMLLSFPTSWENRFGFYLDDGWVYVYRSHYLLGRFRILPVDDGYKMSSVQMSDELPPGLTIDQCIQCAKVAAEDLGSSSQYHYLYKTDCKENPYTRSDVVEYKFWECEKMFADNIAATEWCGWIKEARRSVSDMDDMKWVIKSKSIGADSSAILCYISHLYSKFCPFESQDWLLDY